MNNITPRNLIGVLALLAFIAVVVVACSTWAYPAVRDSELAQDARMALMPDDGETEEVAVETETEEAAVEAETEEAAVETETEEAAVETETEEATVESETKTDANTAETYMYEPGGESFGQWATDVILTEAQVTFLTELDLMGESVEEDVECGRIWQATNLENLPWTAIFCDWKTSKTAPELQWPHPTQLTVTGDGIVEFWLLRDLVASDEETPDPYLTANVKNSPLGLGWQVQGFNGTVCVNDDCQALSGGGVFQIPFPADYEGAIKVRIVVDDGQVQFWQGERITSNNTWELPAPATTTNAN